MTWQRCEAQVCDCRSQPPIHWVTGFIPGKVLPGPPGLGPAVLDLIICLGHAVTLGNVKKCLHGKHLSLQTSPFLLREFAESPKGWE